MGIVIETFGKCNASCLSKAVMFQAGSSPEDKVSMNVEPECSTLQKIHAFKADRFMDLFGDYQGEWKGNEIDTDCAVGKEVLE